MKENNEVLGLDCNGNEIDEFRVLKAKWSNEIDIEDLKHADPRQYCAVKAEDGQAYAISVFDWWSMKLIRERENRSFDEDIPVVVKPIKDMENYELALNSYRAEFYYNFDREELRNELNKILKKSQLTKAKVKTKTMNK